MPRGPRHDVPGRLFHLMNRGSAHRTMFEHQRDYRFFLSRLAYAARREEVDVLAYTLMSTHFHLVVRSRGLLSTAMRRIQSEYTRFFNRTRRRDGALQRGRFLSKSIRSEMHLANVFPYVDANPVQAGMVTRPEDWPWGSAGARARGKHRPWLSTDFAAFSYFEPDPLARDVRHAFIEARLTGQGDTNRFEAILHAKPHHLLEWMRRNARLADGVVAEAPVAGASTIVRVVEQVVSSDAVIEVPGGHGNRRAALLLAGLLRDLAGCSFRYIARHLQVTDTRAKRLYTYHHRCVEESAEYGRAAAEIVAHCLAPLARSQGR